ncbi:LacI family DNA-binding transcriptional regulator [Victivallis sp. Marseille-Q1083]|uniref:LacI family DNA-binding transcriptional regulator n=1 Tax=Victivallis sp. Marseille-Q1083 TaxID=2717288 RepID=UPI00158D12EC|nr:LacI family DNA-binding transcriptional regulator [Victivallis sp. Marseille-Q1083]
MDIREFAREIGISYSTVSRAFSGRGRVKEETRQRIFNRAAELGYRPNGRLAENNIPFVGDLIAVVYTLPVNELYSDYLFSEVFRGIQDVLTPLGINASPHIIFESVPLLDSFYFDVFKAANVKGVIWFTGTKFYPQLKEKIDYWGKPNLAIGNLDRHDGSNIGFDVYAGAKQVGEYFRRTGRVRPAIVLGEYNSQYMEKWRDAFITSKEQGFLDGMQCSVEEVEWVVGGYQFSDGYNAFRKLRNTGKPIDCVFCENDTLGAGFLCAAGEAGINIPDELAVFGFDNVAFSQFTNPPLSTVDFTKFEIGRAAASGLLDLINGKEKKINLMFKSNLVLRRSS